MFFFSKPGQVGVDRFMERKREIVKFLYGTESKIPKQNEWVSHWEGCGYETSIMNLPMIRFRN